MHVYAFHFEPRLARDGVEHGFLHVFRNLLNRPAVFTEMSTSIFSLPSGDSTRTFLPKPFLGSRSFQSIFGFFTPAGTTPSTSPDAMATMAVMTSSISGRCRHLRC